MHNIEEHNYHGGHTHEHNHEHEHNGHVHSHSHVHKHVHEGGEESHSHDHIHEGTTDHHHHHNKENSTKEEALALLAYMVAHNEHHAQELSELAVSMMNLELSEAAEEIESAVSDFKEGNLKLRSALTLLQSK